MASKKIGKQIDKLIDEERWQDARTLIESALKKEPESHWLWTQLGETYYEEQNYEQALHHLIHAKNIVADCPLMLWHLAGTLDALGQHDSAIDLFTWLLASNRTSEDDPCWESDEWTRLLKTDCIYRLGVCYKHNGDKIASERWLRKYIALCMTGLEGSYSVEEAQQHFRPLKSANYCISVQELQEEVERVRQVSGSGLIKSPPAIKGDAIKLVRRTQSRGRTRVIPTSR